MDKKILIQGGAGGIGCFAIQYCQKVLGMIVVATCSTEHIALCKELGADVIVDYKTTKFEDVISDCDIVLDPFSYLYEKRTLNDSKVLKQVMSKYTLVNAIVI